MVPTRLGSRHARSTRARGVVGVVGRHAVEDPDLLGPLRARMAAVRSCRLALVVGTVGAVLAEQAGPFAGHAPPAPARARQRRSCRSPVGGSPIGRRLAVSGSAIGRSLAVSGSAVGGTWSLRCSLAARVTLCPARARRAGPSPGLVAAGPRRCGAVRAPGLGPGSPARSFGSGAPCAAGGVPSGGPIAISTRAFVASPTRRAGPPGSSGAGTA